MKIKVKVISELLRLASEKEGISPNHAGMGLLSERINEALNEDFFNQKYLYYNIFKKVQKYHDQPEAVIGLNANYLHRLAQFLGFRDFFQFRKSWSQLGADSIAPINEVPANSNEIGPVWYAPKKYSVFNLWRNPDIGSLTKTGEGFVFTGERGNLNISDVDAIQSLRMAGDDDEYWIEVRYQSDSAQKTAYFANAQNPLPRLNLGQIEPLYLFFNDIQQSNPLSDA